MRNANYNKLIRIYQTEIVTDQDGFQTETETDVLICKARVKTLRGYTLIKNGSDFESAFVNFTIRFPKVTKITRDMLIEYMGKIFTIEYLNNIDFNCEELEIQAKEVTH